MNKQRIPFLMILTTTFAVFTLGLFLGESPKPTDISVNASPCQASKPGLPPEAAASAQSPGVIFPIDINRAGSSELMALPGIGEALAENILAYREENGPFSETEALLNVDGIGQKRLDKINDLITIGG